MAQGFWKGLLHGAVISVAGLVALSLLTPMREEATEGEAAAPKASNPAPDVQAVLDNDTPVVADETAEEPSDTAQDQAEAGVPEPEEAAPVAPEATDSTAAPTGPQAAAVDLPVGSEFGRGDDVAPQMPAPMVSDVQSRQTDAPAVSAPTAEPAPVAITDPGAQPAADSPDTSLTRTEEPQTDDTPKPDMPVIQEIPRATEVPEMIGGAEPDQSPAVISDDVKENTAGTNEVQAAPSDVTITPVEANEQDAAAASPAMPAPELDLSTPPDLSDLRVLDE